MTVIQLELLPDNTNANTSVKSRLVLLFWYRLTWVVPGKGSLNVCSSVLA